MNKAGRNHSGEPPSYLCGNPLAGPLVTQGKYTRTVWGHKFGPGARQSLAQDHRYPVESRANLDPHHPGRVRAELIACFLVSGPK